MKSLLYGEAEHEPNPEIVAQLAQEIYAYDLLPLMITHMIRLEFEVKMQSPIRISIVPCKERVCQEK